MMTRHRLRTDPGVRESNAGDDFHILWAARRALDLLKPHSGLTKVLMEGVDPLDHGDDNAPSWRSATATLGRWHVFTRKKNPGTGPFTSVRQRSTPATRSSTTVRTSSCGWLGRG